MTLTIDNDGTVLTETIDDEEYPANYSFKIVNDYVHDANRHFEELQYLCLGMANEIEKIKERGHSLEQEALHKN